MFYLKTFFASDIEARFLKLYISSVFFLLSIIIKNISSEKVPGEGGRPPLIPPDSYGLIQNLVQVVSCEFCEIFKNTYFENVCEGLSLKRKILTGVSFYNILGFYYERTHNSFTIKELRQIHSVFRTNAFFQLSLSVAKCFIELSLRCCLRVAYYMEALSYRDRLYFVYLSLGLHIGLFMSYLCDLFLHHQFHFYYN